MSLNWNLTKCNRKPTGRTVADCDDDSHDSDCKKCPRTPELLIHDADGMAIPWAVTNALIWATMAVQMPGIADAKAAREFALRIAVYQKLFGAWLHTTGKGGGPRPITTAEVLAHVGLYTNVSLRPRGQFLKAMGEQVARDVERDEIEPELRRLSGAHKVTGEPEGARENGGPADYGQEARDQNP